jgi:ferredoxin
MNKPIDYAALQKQMAERNGCRSCGECVEVSYEFINPEILRRVRLGDRLDGWVEQPHRAGYVHHCTYCREYNASQPNKWVADINPERFAAYVAAQDCAFIIDGMKCLLPNTHPMFEKPRLGSMPEWVREALDKTPADDGGGFKLL